MAPPTETETDTIDRLLEAYLALLDEYTALRATLHTRQADLYHSLARANFSADRGIRYYGQDYYDERMQAGRRLAIQPGGQDGITATFTIASPPLPTEQPSPPTKQEKDAEEEEEEEEEDDTNATNTKRKPTDPLRWFGILTPAPLRQAQGHAITAVEDIIPRLATVSGEMAALELAVRRARKKRRVREEKEKSFEGRGVVEGVVG